MASIIAVDIGNTRAKFGFFPGDEREPAFAEMICDFGGLADWLAELPVVANEPLSWEIAQTAAASTTFPWNESREQLACARPNDSFRLVARRDVPMPIKVDFPEKVGIDRLLAAFAASRWKKVLGRGYGLVVDAGSAVTVDLIDPDGAFCGGAIFPGFFAMSASLASISPRLPRLEVDEIGLPDYPGKNTEAALASGMYWGTVGMIRQCFESVQTNEPVPICVFLTGGAADALVPGLLTFLDESRLIRSPYMVLAGIACVNGNLRMAN